MCTTHTWKTLKCHFAITSTSFPERSSCTSGGLRSHSLKGEDGRSEFPSVFHSTERNSRRSWFPEGERNQPIDWAHSPDYKVPAVHHRWRGTQAMRIRIADPFLDVVGLIRAPPLAQR